MDETSGTTGGGGDDRRDPVKDLQARLEAAMDEVRPKIRKAFDELDARVDEAMADIRPRAQNAMNEVRPKVDQFVADVQPRLDSLLDRLQTRIEELRRDLDSRASRTNRPAGEIGTGVSASSGDAPGYTPPPGNASDLRGPGSDESIP